MIFKTMSNAIKRYGEEKQKIVAIEELSELQKAITKDLRGTRNYDNIKEEIADVCIMIIQLQMMYRIPEYEIFAIIEEKVHRLEQRIIQDSMRSDI